MNSLNQTTNTEFILIGFKNLYRFRILLFTFFLLIYIVTILGNLFIVCLVPISNNLHTPMYFFLSNLSLSDFLISSNIEPNMLHILWTEKGNIPVSNCIIQFYIFGSITSIECLLLTVMSFDRYLAVCNPLRYSSVMTLGLCQKLIIFSWTAGFLPTLPVTTYLFRIQFCHSNTIDHFFCDLAPLLELSCSDISVAKFVVYALVFLFTFFPFIFITVSYGSILSAIIEIKSIKRRKKAFSTCSSHLAVVSLYYGTLFTLYGVPSKKQSININKILSLLYTFVTPLLNPFIYSLKNQEIGRALEEILKTASKLIK